MTSKFFAASSFLLLAACSGANLDEATVSHGDEALSSTRNAEKVTDACTAAAIGVAAADAFGDNNLQHLVGLTVDGTPGVGNGRITYEVTTSNDEDGETTRKVVALQRGPKCTISSIAPLDGTMPSATNAEKAFKAVVDTCTSAALEAAAKLAFAGGNDLQHLHGLRLDDGDLAVAGLLKFNVRIGNVEDGDTDYAVSVQQEINHSSGRSTCTVKSATQKQ
jgi:hypothetical protein